MNQKNKQIVINTLDTAIGMGQQLPSNERVFHCPFCHHHKKKLSVNLITQKYQCWVCGAKGRSITSLLRKLNVSYNDILNIKRIYGDTDTNINTFNEDDEYIELYLPKEFISFNKKPKSIDPIYSTALKYLFNRNIGWDIIQKYNIGYCDGGLYSGRIIIPSYDSNDKLNWFEARTFYDTVSLRYMKPPISRNVIVFESHINWKEPITLVEGVFDAFSVRRNVIPLLGKTLPPILKEQIYVKGVNEINILLDNDAVDQSTQTSHHFSKNGIVVKNIIPPDGQDYGDMGFKPTIELIKQSPYSTWDSLILNKLNTI